MRRLLAVIGSVFCSGAAFAQVSNITTVAWEKVPPVVQTSIQAYTAGAPASAVERGIENGQAVYSVTLPHAAGQTKVIVRENGSVVPPTNLGATPPVVAPVPEQPVRTNTLPEGVTVEVVNGRAVYNVVSEGDIQASQVQITPDGRVYSTVQVGPQGVVQMQKVPRASVPPAVERAIQTQTGPGQIVDIVRGSYNGQSVYEVVYNQLNERIKLRVAENGVVLAQSIISTEDRQIIDVEPYIGYSQIPVVVQTTLSAAAGDNQIESVRQEVVDGRVTYVGTYRDNGQPVTIRISQTGQLLRP